MNIIVVGAGVIGYAVAYELASRGARVQVVDSRGPARGATGASAGILAPHIEGHSDTLLRLGVCSMTLWDDFLHRVQIDSGHRVEYSRTGTLQVAFDDAQDAELKQLARRLTIAEVPHDVLRSADVVKLEPSVSRTVTSGLLVHPHGFVGPVPLVDALVRASERRGVSTVTARALRFDEGSTATVETDTGVLNADAIIIATGSWSVELLPSGQEVVRPIRGQLLELSVDERLLKRVVWSVDCYIVPWSDGTVLAGATVEDVGFDESTTADGVQGLLLAAISLVPSLRTARFQGARAGLRPKTDDELPVIGRSSTMPHVFYAVGHYRNGVLLAPLTASLLADLVLDGRARPELADVRPDRFGL